MRTALYRYYKDKGKTRYALQGKVFEVGDSTIYYRDLHEHKGRLWKEEGSWNLDFRTYQWLRSNGVDYIDYFWKKDGRLYRTTPRKVAGWLEKGKVKLEFVGGHRQLFLPKRIFKVMDKYYRDPWITYTTDAGKQSLRTTASYAEWKDSMLRLREIAVQRGIFN